MTDQKRRFEDQLPEQPLEWEGEPNPRADEVRVERQQALLNCAAALLKAERAEASAVVFPGSAPEQYVMVGTADDILRLLPIPGATDGILRAQMREITTLLVERQDVDHLLNDPDLVALLAALTTMAVRHAGVAADKAAADLMSPHPLAAQLRDIATNYGTGEYISVRPQMLNAAAEVIESFSGAAPAEEAKPSQDALEEALMNVLAEQTSLSTDGIDMCVPRLVAAIPARALPYEIVPTEGIDSDLYTRAAPAAQPADDSDFKNFHRLLCERFGYTHDERDWKRDQLSLVEHIATTTSQPDEARDAARYRYLRGPATEIGNVIDKEFAPGKWEYRAGEELDAAIDAAMGLAPTAASPSHPDPEKQQGWISVDERLPDGRNCLAVYETSRGKQRTIRAMYVAKFTVEAQGDDCYSEINDENDIEYLREGWYELIDNWGEYSSVHVSEGVVTHWMPLPPTPDQCLPAGSAKGGEQAPAATEISSHPVQQQEQAMREALEFVLAYENDDPAAIAEIEKAFAAQSIEKFEQEFARCYLARKVRAALAQKGK